MDTLSLRGAKRRSNLDMQIHERSVTT